MEIKKWNKLDFVNNFQSKERIMVDLAEVQEEIQRKGYNEDNLSYEKTILADL